MVEYLCEHSSVDLAIETLTNSTTSANVTIKTSPDREEPGSRNIKRNEDLPPAPIDGVYDKWFFISGAAV